MVKMIKQKRGTIVGRKMLWYVFFVIISTIIFIILVKIFFTECSDISKIPPDLENYLMIQRFLKSPECFVHQDDIRYTPSVIDWEKFNKENLNYCYVSSDNVKGFRLILKNKETQEEKIIKTNNWRGAFAGSKIFNIKIYKDNALYNGELTVEIQNAK